MKNKGREDLIMDQLIITVFVEQPLALRGLLSIYNFLRHVIEDKQILRTVMIQKIETTAYD